MKASGRHSRNGTPRRFIRSVGDVAAGHGEGAVREVDEVHQPQRHRQAHRQHEEQHAVGDAVEEDREHRDRPFARLGADAAGRRRPRACLVSGYWALAAFTGSLTFGDVANSTL